jgi:hypothetical protein
MTLAMTPATAAQLKCSFALVLAMSCMAACSAGPDDDGFASASATLTVSASVSASDGTGTSADASADAGTTGDASADASQDDTLADATTDGAKFDVMTMPDVMPMGECLECAITIASQQSGVFDVTGTNIFATAVLEAQVVYALGTHGAGRFIATADSSLPFNETSDCPIVEWLGGAGNANPTMFYFGWTPSDGPISWTYPGTAAGVHLPPQYIGDPAALAADYDIVMYLEASGQFDAGDQPSDAEMQTLLDYVEIHGGGLYVSSEFADPNGGAYLNATDLASVNRVLLPLGLESLQVSLAWGNVDGNIDFDCFPAPVG